MRRKRAVSFVACALLLIAPLIFAASVLPHSGISIVLPSGWIIESSPAVWVRTGTMPQGATLAPSGKRFAVVESGFNPARLRIYTTQSLQAVATIPLAGAFGQPVWLDENHVLVAGANAQAIFDVAVAARTAREIAFPPHTFPVAVAASDDVVAVATDDDGGVRIGTLASVGQAQPLHVGTHPSGLAFSLDGRTLFVSDRSGATIDAIDVGSRAVRTVRTRLHPSALLVADNHLFVAESDADRVGIYTLPGLAQVAQVFVGDTIHGQHLAGVSPNALAWSNGTLYVSLGAANEVAAIRGDRVVGRIPAGRYPTALVAHAGRLFVIDGKGEGAAPNPEFNVFGKIGPSYVAAIEYGSIRVYRLARVDGRGNPQGTAGWARPAPPQTVVRFHGPIRHVFFILKENRTYDQILGDIAGANGDSHLAYFGEPVTPNQHALAKRFGIFDNAYTNGEVSDPGHDWADAAFANDYVERVWPSIYAGRSDGDDTDVGSGASEPANGYLWDDAVRAGVSFRDYGEMTKTNGELFQSVRPGIGVEVTREPLGVVVAITPWNFPLAIPAWKVAPALAYGNCAILKPAELTPACASALADIIARAGIPQGVFHILIGSGRTVGNTLVTSPDVDAVTFTGSVAVGKGIAIAAASRMAKVQLEMGGKNPLVVLDDAELGIAVECAIQGAYYSTGQRCTASSRLIVTEGIHDGFVKAVVERMKQLVVGDALDSKTHIGPVVDDVQLAKDLAYLEVAREEGARLAFGGERVKRSTDGYFLQPILWTETNNAMRINREEIFGPAASVICVEDFEEALRIANDTPFGLVAGICTTSLKYATQFKREAQAGMVMVNVPTAGVDYHVPFGGSKASSYGSREQGTYARDFYTTTRTAYTRP